MTYGLKRERYVDKKKQGMHRCDNPAMTSSGPDTRRAFFIECEDAIPKMGTLCIVLT